MIKRSLHEHILWEVKGFFLLFPYILTIMFIFELALHDLAALVRVAILVFFTGILLGIGTFLLQTWFGVDLGIRIVPRVEHHTDKKEK